VIGLFSYGGSATPVSGALRFQCGDDRLLSGLGVLIVLSQRVT
jgi:hypothetical protein